MSHKYAKVAIILAIIVVIAFAAPALAKKGGGGTPGGGGNPGGGGGGHRPPTELTNNLSFPVIAVDGFAITQLVTSVFSQPYTGTYPGLTAAEIAALQASGPWYPQKTVNRWQADFVSQPSVDVSYVDWSDSMETVYPKLNTPFRLEMVLFKLLDVPMTGYTMAVLENPSSPSELQGTNTTTYEGNYATVISSQPRLVVQYLGTTVPGDLIWDGARWTSGTATLFDDTPPFAVELNVGGKYIWGASSGGWVPDFNGFYRITFYAPSGSGVNMTTAITADAALDFAPSAGTAAHGEIDIVNNLAYIDVEVGGEGGGGGE